MKGKKGFAMDNGKYKVDIAFESEIVVGGKKAGGSYEPPCHTKDRGLIAILGWFCRFDQSEVWHHETLHDCCASEGIDALSEDQVQMVSGYFCRLFRNNPQATKFFIEGLNPAYRLSIKQGKTKPNASKKQGKKSTKRS
jgi:hypothetical protein